MRTLSSLAGRPLRAAVIVALLAALLPAANATAAHINLTFTTQPGNGTGGSPLSVQPVVHANSGGPVGGLAVTLEIRPADNFAGGVLSCTSGTAVVTNGAGNATFTGCEVDLAQNNYRLRASAPHATNQASAFFHVIPGPAHHLDFGSYPNSPTPSLLDPQPIVTVVDEGGNIVPGDTRTIALSTNQNPGTFLCTGGLSKNATDGFASFGGCTQAIGAAGYTLTATTVGLADNDMTGPPFTVTGGTATRLLLCWGPGLPCSTTPPTTITGGTPFPVQPTIRVVDAADNTITADNSTLVGLSILSGTPATGGPGILSCTGGLVRTVSNGVASFTGCSIDRTGTGYRLLATSNPAYTAAATNPFDVAVGPAHHLAFSAYPANPTSAALTPQPSVAVVDAGGNTVTTDARTVTLGTNQNTGTFSCTGGLSKAAVSGVATFTGCTQTAPATGYTLTATTTGLNFNTVTGSAFAVTTGATRLLVCWGATTGACNQSPPTASTGGVAFPTQPHVRVVDAANQTITADDTTVVTLARTPNTPVSGGPGTLTCTGGLVRAVTDGIASFNGCTIDRAGTGYRLRATSSPAVTLADSNPFNVAVGPAAKLGFLAQPTSGNVGQVLSPNITVAVQDAGGNTVTTGQSAAITLLISPPNPTGAALSCTGGTTVGAPNGVATFTGCSVNRGGTFTLTATPGGIVPPGNITPATSAPIVISGAQAQLTLSASGTVITWGQTVFFAIGFGAGGANRPFTMQASTDGAGWSTIATPFLMTDTFGQATFPYRPARNLYYRAAFAGAADLSPATSNIVRVVVRQIALLRPTNIGAVDDVLAGTTIRFTTTVRPARPELPKATVTFVVYGLLGRTWTLVSTRDVVIDANGLAVADVTFSGRGSWYVRSIARPTFTNANSVWSPLERYDVR